MASQASSTYLSRAQLLVGIALAVMLGPARVLAAHGGVTLCHRPPDNPNNYTTLTVGSAAAVAAHLAHGDVLGTCESACPAGLCGDGKACTIDGGTWNAATEHCDCAYTAATCDDGNPCTDDSCDPIAGCVHTSNDANLCDDSNACTSGDHCSAGQCVGTPYGCEAPGACHEGTGTCNGDGTCSYTDLPDGTVCDDGDVCTSSDHCSAGTCIGTPYGCEAPDQCHQGTGTCNGDGTCSYTDLPDGTECDDGNACTGCPSGGCQVSYDIDATLLDNQDYFCDDTGEHRYNGCYGDWGFHWTDLGGSLGQVTQVQIQLHSAVACDPGTIHPIALNGTTIDNLEAQGECGCSPASVLQTVTIGTPTAYVSGGTNSFSVEEVTTCEGLSSDGLLGSGLFARVTVTYAGDSDQCVGGYCVAGPPAPNGMACDDDTCTTDSQCNAGSCVGTALSCDDQNPCTNDTCDPVLGCTHTYNDGSVCNGTGVCQSGQCIQDGVSPCQEGTDPETGDPWVVCAADASTAWLSANSSGYYHAEQICQLLGYGGVGAWGGTCGNVCGYCQAPTSCQNPGDATFSNGSDPPNICGTDTYGGILCTTVHWLCVQ